MHVHTKNPEHLNLASVCVCLIVVYVSENQRCLLAIFSFDGNTGTMQECCLSKTDCKTLAFTLNMSDLSVVNIIYNTNFEIEKNDTNEKAANQLAKFVDVHSIDNTHNYC